MDLFLKSVLFGDDDLDLTDCPDIDDDEDFSDPVAKHFEALDLQKTGVPTFSSDWDAPIGTMSAKGEASESLGKVRDEATRVSVIDEGAAEVRKAWKKRL